MVFFTIRLSLYKFSVKLQIASLGFETAGEPVQSKPYSGDTEMKLTTRTILIYILTTGLLTSSSFVIADGYDKDDDEDDRNGLTICEKTAKKMFRSCRNEIKEEYFATTAKCINFGDPIERAECFELAVEALHEDKEGCSDQREARNQVCELLAEDRYDPEAFLHNDNFVEEPDGTNPYFSLAPGHTYVARAGEDFEETIVVTVTNELRDVLGVNCRLVVDIVLVEDDEGDLEAVEVTDDYYALAVNGDVHYCGEVARNFEDGILVDLDGSFEAGRDYAKSGVLIKAQPFAGDAHRQEYLLGEAEDVIQYVAGEASKTSVGDGEGGENPAFPCNDNCIKTEEFIPPEPGSGEFKYFKAGVGFVLGVALEDGVPTGERDELVCTGDSLTVLSDCGIDETTVGLLCELSPVAFCE